MIHFAYTILYVSDVKESLEFYERAFGLTRKFISEDGVYGELITGSTTLAFAAAELAASNLKDGFIASKPGGRPFGIELGFTTENVEQTLQTSLNAGACLVEAPKTKAWGQTVAYIQDPDGFLLEICTPMD